MTMQIALVPLSDEWARRELKIVKLAGIPLPRLAQDLIRHLAGAASAAIHPSPIPVARQAAQRTAGFSVGEVKPWSTPQG